MYEPALSTYPALVKWLKETPVSSFTDNIDPRVNLDTVESELFLSWAPIAEG